MSLPAPTLGALAWVAGVALGAVAVPGGRPAAAAAILAVAGAAMMGGLALLLRPALPALLVALVLAGVARAAVPSVQPPPVELAHRLAGADVVLSGTVADDPRPSAGGIEIDVAPTSLAGRTGGLPAAGHVLVRVSGGGDAAVGDSIQAAGRLKLPAPTPDFDRRAYLLQRGITLEMSVQHVRVLARSGGVRALPGWLRDRYRAAIATLLPAPHAAVLIGIVLGVRSGIPPDLDRALIATGLVHLLVLSGLKVAVFTRLVTALLLPALGRLAVLPAISLVALYALAGGAGPAAVRAAAMGGLTLLAGWLGRPAHVWTSLAWTAAAMLGWRPELAWDVGFQLSFAGTAAIILLTPAVERRLHRLPRLVREPFAVTLAAQVGTIPFTAAGFHVLSPVAPVANALTLPLLPAVVAAGLLLVPLAAVPAAGSVLALPLAGTLAYIEQVATLLARVPGAAVAVPGLPAEAGAGYYAAVAGGLLSVRLRGRLRKLTAVAALLLPLLAGGAELVAWSRPAPAAAALAIGDGEAVLVSGPEGALLIGAGPSPAKLAAEAGGRLPPWRRHLDAVFIDGSSAGQVGGLAGSGLGTERVVLPAADLPGTAWRSAAATLAAEGATIRRLAAGDRLRVAGFAVEALAPERGVGAVPGASDLALRVVSPGGRSVCTFGSLDVQAQAAAAARLRGRCTVLVLPGSGRSAPAPELLERARPEVVVASTGSGRLARGLPLGLLRRTDQEGTVVVGL